MQALEVFQSLWAMEQRIPGQPEAGPESWFEQIADAGFHGVCLDPAVHEIDDMLALQPLFERHGLKCMINAFPSTLDEMRPLLQLAGDMQAVAVNAIGSVMPLGVAEGAEVVRRWMDDAASLDVFLLFETHRDCTLNDLYYTLQLMDQVPEMRLCADLSHYVIDREMRLPICDRDAGFIQRILGRSDCFQGRISNAEQVQVPIGFAQHQAWVEQFKNWWLDGMAAWRKRNEDDARLVFLCELGPPPYAITDARQRELSDRWQEALTIRSWVKELWAQAGAGR